MTKDNCQELSNVAFCHITLALVLSAIVTFIICVILIISLVPSLYYTSEQQMV